MRKSLSTKYVLGFAYIESTKQVILIKKAKPEWQKGFLNGVGGKVEPNETLMDAMIREFEEETQIPTTKKQWYPYCIMKGQDWTVTTFITVFRDSSFITKELISSWYEQEEQVSIRYLDQTSPGREDFLSNVSWLIGLGLDYYYNKMPFDPITIRYDGLSKPFNLYAQQSTIR